MAYYRVVGSSCQTAEPIEKVFFTAIEANFESKYLRRVCGKFGKVEVWGKDGRGIGFDKLERLAQAEKAAARVQNRDL